MCFFYFLSFLSVSSTELDTVESRLYTAYIVVRYDDGVKLTLVPGHGDLLVVGRLGAQVVDGVSHDVAGAQQLLHNVEEAWRRPHRPERLEKINPALSKLSYLFIYQKIIC